MHSSILFASSQLVPPDNHLPRFHSGNKPPRFWNGPLLCQLSYLLSQLPTRLERRHPQRWLAALTGEQIFDGGLRASAELRELYHSRQPEYIEQHRRLLRRRQLPFLPAAV